MTTMIDDQRVEALAATFQGELLRPGTDGYEDGRLIYNGLVDKRPALIARCTTPADVVAAIRCARDGGHEISVRGGGHNVGGSAVTDGGVMIDLAGMKQIFVDLDARTLRAQGGVTWAELNDAAAEHGLAVTGGAISSTGVGGFTLGGGLGWLMSMYGLAADNLVSVELVTAGGDVLEASQASNPDLFWALRGGGGNFGVATSFEFRLHPLTQVVGGLIAHPFEAAPDVLRFFREYFGYDKAGEVFKDNLKEFGYDAFVPDMTPKDLQGADFVGYDAPPAIEAKPGEKIRVPIFVSHYSDVKGQARLNWWVKGVDGDGQVLEVVSRNVADTTRKVEWTPNSVTEQKPIEFSVPKAFVGALGLELVDSEGKRLAANFVNIVVTPETPAPRVERRGDREAVIRFDPHDFASMKFTEGSDAPLGKVWGRGSGWLTYKLKVPASIVKAKPASFTVMFEAAAKNDRKQVDWPSRANAQDNPQTDERLNPSTIDVLMNGQKVERFKLPDDPADAKGVLSHLRRIEHGGYGYHFTTDPTRFPAATLEDLNAGKPLVLTFLVFVDAADKNGLTLYGAEAGAFPFDPTLVITTEADLPADLGVKPSETVAIDVAAARKVAIVRAGDSNGGPPTVWSYTTTDPGKSWLDDAFDASAWKRGPAGFGTPETPALQDKTLWDTPAIWLRTTVVVPAIGVDDSLVLHVFHDEDVEVFVNGKRVFAEEGHISKYRDVALGESAKSLFRPGKNVIAARCKQTTGGQGIDLGIAVLRGE